MPTQRKGAAGRSGSRFSRGHWLARLLKPRAAEQPAAGQHEAAPGLLLIQIDGLSRRELERALKLGEMPFLRSLVEDEHYRLDDLYSGLPSSTPAVQGEFFYGQKSCVPAFSFRDPDTGKIVRMYEPETARARQADLALRCEGRPLLENGSAYTDIFTGGAAEAHFTPAFPGWGLRLRSASPAVLVALFMVHLLSLFRISVYVLIEFVLALTDFMRGLTLRGEFSKELKFIPTRVAICILMRELCVTGAKLDISRGLPVIHVNFIGYDEQAHRRGPSSLFAHWTLKGIDDAIRAIWRASIDAAGRRYQCWIYSDHGQCKAVPYFKHAGYGIATAVEQVVDQRHSLPARKPVHDGESIQTHRVRFLGGNKLQALFSVLRNGLHRNHDAGVQITALGPVAFVYGPDTPRLEDKRRWARDLVGLHRVPAVLFADADGTIVASTARGEFRLPAQIAELVGADHPFLAELASDLLAVCRHASAGDLTLLGWCRDSARVTFAVENGAHGGLTPEETGAFCLLPPEVRRARPPQRHFMRPLDLRVMALDFLAPCGSTRCPRDGRLG